MKKSSSFASMASSLATIDESEHPEHGAAAASGGTGAEVDAGRFLPLAKTDRMDSFISALSADTDFMVGEGAGEGDDADADDNGDGTDAQLGYDESTNTSMSASTVTMNQARKEEQEDALALRKAGLLKKSASTVSVAGTCASECFSTAAMCDIGQNAIEQEDEWVPDDTTYEPLSYREVFHLATQGGAEVLGMGDVVGNFLPGKKLDCLVIDVNAAEGPIDMFGDEDLLEIFQKFIFLGDDRNIANVYVDGKRVL